MKIILISMTLLMSACTGTNTMKANRTANQYTAQLQHTAPTSEQDVRVVFGRIFNDYKQGATEANIRATYADELYFNDTFKIIENIDELVHYMTESAGQVNSTTVEILEVIPTDTDYYVRWTMHMDLTIKGKDIKSTSIGMSQLRFNDQGKVVFHQDFWDSSEAFYEHLPWIGYFLRKVKGMM